MSYNDINKKTYDKISENWDTKRTYYWKPVIKFVEDIKDKKNKNFLDLGCGGGRHLSLALEKGFSKENIYGLDFSSGQLEVVSKKGFQTILSDLEKLNIEDNSFDTIICIAAHHHLMEKERQLKSLLEMKRVLKDGGKIFLSNWHPDENFINEQVKKGKFEFIDDEKKKVKVTYDLEGEKHDRFYYLFEINELKELCKKAGFKIIDEKLFEGNIYLTLQ